jgi:hypothetical protein
MAAMKPRTGDGPMECPKEGRGYVLRVPLEGGGRLVVELNAQEVKDLGAVLKDTVSSMPNFFGINEHCLFADPACRIRIRSKTSLA